MSKADRARQLLKEKLFAFELFKDTDDLGVLPGRGAA